MGKRAHIHNEMKSTSLINIAKVNKGLEKKKENRKQEINVALQQLSASFISDAVRESTDTSCRIGKHDNNTVIMRSEVLK